MDDDDDMSKNSNITAAKKNCYINNVIFCLCFSNNSNNSVRNNYCI